MEVGPQSISGALVTGAGRTIGRGVQIASSPYCNTHAKIHSSDCPASQLRRGGGFPWRFRTLRLAIPLSQVEHKILLGNVLTQYFANTVSCRRPPPGHRERVFGAHRDLISLRMSQLFAPAVAREPW